MSSEVKRPAVPLSHAPQKGQSVAHGGVEYTTVKEGKAYILVPPGARTEQDPKAAKGGKGQDGDHQSVFYNPIQQFNRDISVLAIMAFGEQYLERKRERISNGRKKRKEKKEKKIAERAHADETAMDTIKEEQEGTQHMETDETNIPKLTVAIPEGDKVSTSPVKDLPARTNPLKRGFEEIEDSEEIDEHEYLYGRTPDDLRAKAERIEHNLKRLKAGHLLTSESVSHEHTPKDTASTTPTYNDTSSQISEDDLLDLQAVADLGAANKRPPANTGTEISFTILDALSATGLRALRYAREIPFATAITANDMSRKATSLIAVNIAHNRLNKLIKVRTSNAVHHMRSVAIAAHPTKYEVIDLDPYGTAVPFLDAAIDAVTDGGLLCVTCTDTGVFNSVAYLEKAFSLYGGVPINDAHYAEGGLRLILHCIATTAAKYGKAIEPLLSLSVDYYARIFVRVYHSPAHVKFLAGKTMTVHECDNGCGAWSTEPMARNVPKIGKDGRIYYKHSPGQTTSSSNCEHCGSKTHVSQ
jgi:tRNA (guanine26-N2/guanine27-N2)-dimethyltransferase